MGAPVAAQDATTKLYVDTGLGTKANTVHTHTKSDVTDFAHTHPISEVVNLQTTLNAKAALVHSHPISEVTNLQTTLNGKAALVHTHTKA